MELGDENLKQEEMWGDIFSLPFRATRETKIQSFVYKLSYRLTPCGRHLHRIGIKDSPLCPTCREEDTITHFFLGCSSAKTFWERLAQWCKRYLDINITDLSEVELILGVTKKSKNRRITNWILATAKYYIQKRKLFHQSDISLMGYLAESRARLHTEKTVCSMRGREREFRYWNRFYAALT